MAGSGKALKKARTRIFKNLIELYKVNFANGAKYAIFHGDHMVDCFSQYSTAKSSFEYMIQNN